MASVNGAAALEHEQGRVAPAVTRAMDILDLLAGFRGVPVSLADLARGIGAAKSSTSNVCSVLETRGMIRREATGYVLGHRNLELGGAFLYAFDQVREFYRLCNEEPALRGELVQLAVLHGREAVFLGRHEGRTPLRLSWGATVGDRFPAALTAVGNALLSTLPEDEVERRFTGVPFPEAFTTRSLRSVPELLEKLREVRETGYALDEGGVFANVVGVAVPVPPRQSGDHTMTVNISRMVPGDTPQLDAAEQDHVVATLRDLAAALTNEMAYGGGVIFPWAGSTD